MSSKVTYFEDLMIDYLQGVLDKTKMVSPDDFDDMWLDLFETTKKLFKQADESYINDGEMFRQELTAIVGIFNNGSLMFPDLVAKALDYVTKTKEKYISPELIENSENDVSLDDKLVNASERSATTNNSDCKAVDFAKE